MDLEALAFKVVVRRVATGSMPFRWQVERDDVLTLVEVSAKRFRSMQEAYEAGRAWLSGYLASRPTPKRQPRTLEIYQLKDVGTFADEPFMDLENDEIDDEDLMTLDHEDDFSVQPD